MSGPPPDGLTDTHMLVLACFAPEPFASPQYVAGALGLPVAVAAMLLAACGQPICSSRRRFSRLAAPGSQRATVG